MKIIISGFTFSFFFKLIFISIMIFFLFLYPFFIFIFMSVVADLNYIKGLKIASINLDGFATKTKKQDNLIIYNIFNLILRITLVIYLNIYLYIYL